MQEVPRLFLKLSKKKCFLEFTCKGSAGYHWLFDNLFPHSQGIKPVRQDTGYQVRRSARVEALLSTALSII